MSVSLTARCVQRLCLALCVFLAACSSGQNDGENGENEAVGSIAQATTGPHLCAPVTLQAGECRYQPVQAFASSMESSGSVYVPSNAIDGDCGTRWSSAFSDPQWLKVDLGTKRPLSRLLVHWEAAASSDYRIEVSDDGNTWTTVAQDENAVKTGSGATRVDTISGLTASARYIRLYSLARNSSYGNSIFELEVFGTGCATAPGCSQIPVFPVSASASSVQSSDLGADRAIDGSSSTRWSSGSGDPQWLSLDLGTSQTVNRVQIDWEAASSSKYEIQTSESQSGPWTVVTTHDDNRLGKRSDDNFGFAATGRFLRIYSKKRSTTFGTSLYEIRLSRESCGGCEQVLTPTASAASSQESDTYAAAKAVDGNYGTRWSSLFADPQWLRLDFGQDRRVTQVIIKWEGASSKNYRLEGAASSSGPWTVLAERSNQPVGARVDIIKDLTVVTRFLRVYSTARTGSYGNSIAELITLGNNNPLACGGDCFLGDRDGDNVKDCFDACPRDPTKTSPGACGCGVADTDTDGDRVPDCIEQADNAPGDQNIGDCGTPSSPAPTTKRCSGGVCPGAAFCNGAGICGNPASCKPAPNCVEKQIGDRWYWICTGAFTWQDARTRCANWSGGTLAVIDDVSENTVLAGNLPGTSAWIAANDVTTDGRWSWANPLSDGNRFWDGAANGKSYFTAYANWVSGSPVASHACAAMTTGGKWASDNCTATKNFICERSDSGPPPGNLVGPMGPVDPGPCVDASTVFKNANGTAMSTADWNASLQACQAGCANNDAACTTACANGPLSRATGNNCPAFSQSELDDVCVLKALANVPRECTTDAECTEPGNICGTFYPCHSASTIENERNNCYPLSPTTGSTDRVIKVCGIPADGCPRVDPDFGPACDTAKLCTDPAMKQSLATPFSQATFTPTKFTPASYFPEPAPADPVLPYPNQGDPCNGICNNQGVNHPWCHLGPQNALPAAPPDIRPDKGGDSGGNLVSFQVDPKLSLTYKANIGPFGLPAPTTPGGDGLTLSAEAGFLAAVNFHIITDGQFKIIDVLASIAAHECSLNAKADLSILDIDFLPLGPGDIPAGVLPTAAQTASCKAAFAALQTAGDRAKKALRDAAEVLRQYKNMLANDDPKGGQVDNFAPSVCQELVEKAPRGFPPVNCAQGVEGAINGYIEYYRRSVLGFNGLDGAGTQLKGLAEQVSEFANNALNYQPAVAVPLFEVPRHDEEMTIAEFQFFIGPIPVNLEITTQVNYQASVGMQAVLRPAAVVEQLMFNSAGQDRSRLFYIQANGGPQAGAALAAFAGVGFGVPGFKAKIGIEAALNLANLMVPVHAGAGLSLGSTPETERPLGTDLASIATGRMLLQPKRYTLGFEYGAGLDIRLRNILGGNIKAKLKLKLLFWSKTWQKTLLEFQGICPGEFTDVSGNTGKAPCTIPLISLDGTGELATGGVPWGVVRPSTPFVELKPLVPNAMVPGIGGLSVIKSEQFFYDSQCECMTRTDPRDCFRDDDCCGADICYQETPATRSTCQGCRANGFTCHENGDCCGGTSCLGGVCKPFADCFDACDPNDDYDCRAPDGTRLDCDLNLKNEYRCAAPVLPAGYCTIPK